MRKVFTITVAALFRCSAWGLYAIPPQTRSQIALEQLSTGNLNPMDNIVYGLPAPPGEVLGDVYIDPNWQMGNVMLTSGVVLERYNLRYDLKSQMLEIQTSIAVKVLDYKQIKMVVMQYPGKARFFVNAGDFRLEGVPLVGILEVMSDGQRPLLRRTTMHIKQPNYNAALDVGSRDATIYKKTDLFSAVGENLTEVKGKKGVLSALSDKEAEVESYIKQNSLGTKKDEDIARIFEYYNSLVGEKAEP